MRYTVLYSDYASTLLCGPIAKRKEFEDRDNAKWFAKKMKKGYDLVICLESRNLNGTTN